MPKQKPNEQVQQIPLSEIRPFKNHPFKVTDDGRYELDGQSYKSLSAVARAITGAHWSGPAFFGLKGTRK